jgi:hypothetical protein
MKKLIGTTLVLISAFIGNAAQFRGFGEGITINAISGNGRVAVGKNGTNLPVQWNAGQVAEYRFIISSFPGYPYAAPGEFLGISDNGRFMVGQFFSDSLGDGALIYDFELNLRLFQGNRSFSGDVSDSGTMIGSYASFGVSRAMRWPGGQLPTLFTNGMQESTFAAAITPDGQIIVGNSTSYSTNFTSQPFRWTEQTGSVGLGNVPGFICSATAISADGNVIVGNGSVLTNGAYAWIAFRWTESEGMVGLGESLPSVSNVRVNGDGSKIAGTMRTSTNSPVEPFIWDATNGIRSLKTVLEGRGVDLSGWILSSAVDISTNGLVIVGNGTNANGHAESWIVVLDDSFPPFESCPRQPLLAGVITTAANIALNWPSDTNATGFKLQRKISTNGWTTLAVFSAAVTNFTEQGIPPGESRSYRLSATNAVDYSLYSEPVTLTVPTGSFEFSDASVIVGENQSFVAIGVSRVSGSVGTATVDFRTTNGTAIAGQDYVSTNGTLAFTNGQTSATFFVQILPDTISEPNENLSLVLSNPATGTGLGSRSQIMLTITNVPNGQLRLGSAVYSASEDAGQIIVLVVRTNGNAGNASVNFATRDGSALVGQDYLATNFTLSFTNGQSIQTVVIPLINDNILENNETFEVVLSQPSGLTLSSPTNATLEIQNDDITIGFVTNIFGVSEKAGTAAISVVRLGATNLSVSVDFSTSDGSATGGLDYTPTYASLTFAPGQILKTVNVTLLHDDVDEFEEDVQLSLLSPSAGVTLSLSNAFLRIHDDLVTISNCDDASLRAAIAAGGKIRLLCDGTIYLTNTITISTNVVLDGSGHSVTISGAGSNRIFFVQTNRQFALSGVTVVDGFSTNGGGLYNDGGAVVITNCSFLRNVARGKSGLDFSPGSPPNYANYILATSGASAFGGAIFNLGTLSMFSTLVASNQVIGGSGGHGGGAADAGSGDLAGGGGVFNSAICLLSNCTFIANAANGGNGGSQDFYGSAGRGGDSFGAGILNRGQLEVFGSYIAFNKGTGGGGGGSRNAPGNGGDAKGGGLCNQGETLIQRFSTVTGNSANGGSFGYYGGAPAYYGMRFGCGIYNAAGSQAAISESTFLSNFSSDTFLPATGGGFCNFGIAKLTNNTFNGNAGSSGAAIYNEGTFSGVNLTVASNSIPNLAGSAIANTNGTLSVKNTILGFNAGGNGQGVIQDLGHNISSDGSCNFTNSGSLNSTDPRLGPLANNGGSTETMLLLLGSPAIDGGDTNFFPPSDQRGFARPNGSAPDIGAVEMTSDPGKFLLSAPSYVVGENGTNITVTVWRTVGYSGTAMVDFGTSNGTAIAGSDYLATNGTFTFLEGEVTKTLSISILDDGVIEPNETLLVYLSTNNIELGQPSEAIVTITNDDFCGVVTFERRDPSVFEDQTNAILKIIRTGGVCGGGSVKFVTSDGTAMMGMDYLATTTTVYFAEGESTNTVFVPIILDSARETDETVLFRLVEPTGLTLWPYTDGALTIKDVPAVTNADQASLMAALQGGGLVKFFCDGTIFLTNAITISTNTVLDGNGHAVTISGNNSNRIFQVQSNVSLTLRNLTLADGKAVGTNGPPGLDFNPAGPGQGGAVLNQGYLTVSNCIFLNNVAQGGTSYVVGGNAQGGAIYNVGSLFIYDSVFETNSVVGGFGEAQGGHVFGGGVFNSGGSLDFRNVQFRNNVARGGASTTSSAWPLGSQGGNAFGGAISDFGGTLSCSNLIFAENKAITERVDPSCYRCYLRPSESGFSGGGAVYLTNSVAKVSDSSFDANETTSGQPADSKGGSLLNCGMLTLVRCSFATNAATGSQPLGGAIYNGGNLECANSLFSSNSVTGLAGANGGTYNFGLNYYGFPGGNGKKGGGGAIFNSGTVVLEESALVQNQATGGKGGDGGAGYNGYWGGTGGDGDWGAGGAVFNQGNFFATNATFRGNLGTGGNGGAGGPTRLGGALSNDLGLPGKGGNGGQGQGGGIFNNGVTALSACSFQDNQSSAGIGGIGGFRETDNLKGSDGSQGFGFGGAIANYGTLEIENGTIASNTVTAGTFGGGSGIFSTNSSTIFNSVILSNVLSLSVALTTNDFQTGFDGTFEVLGSDLASSGYSWEFNRTNIAAINEPVFVKPNLQTTDAGIYSVMFLDDESGVRELSVLIPPAISVAPQNQTLFSGNVVTFAVKALGIPLGYQWFFNSLPISGATNAAYSFTAQITNIGTYSITISNAAGITNASAMLSMPPVIVTQPQNQFASFGENLRLQVFAAGTGPLAYQWRFNGSDIPDATGTAFSISNLRTTNAGSYSVAVSNAFGIIVSSNAVLTLFNLVYWQNTNGRAATWFLNGTNFLNSTFLTAQPSSSAWRIIGLNDFNNDGQTDLLWRNTNGVLSVWLMNQTNRLGTVLLRNGQPIGRDWRFVGFGDFNNDTFTDIVWQHTDRRLAAWFMNGTNFLSAGFLRNGQTPGSGWRAMTVHDFDHNGSADVLFQHDDGRLAMWMMNGTTFLNAISLRNGKPVGPGWRINGLSDFDDNGSKDILFRHTDGRLAVWFMNQTSFVSSASLRNSGPVSSDWRIVGVR